VKKIDYYIFKKFLGTFFFALALIIVVSVVFDFSEKIDDFITNKAPFNAIIKEYYLNFIPYFSNLYTHLFVFIAVIFFTSKMATHSEIIAILSCGVSYRRMMFPYLLAAGFIAVFTFVMGNYVIPYSNVNRLKFEEKYFNRNYRNTDRNSDARYWFDEFLKVRQREDDYYQTETAIAMCKQYVTKQLPNEFDLDKADQAEMLNDSATYFKENENFDMKDFADQVIRQPEVVESFLGYKADFEENNELELADSFDISDEAVKKKSRYLKSVIKLDKNFHVYIHGKRERVKKGIDPETGMNYYQLLFENEE